MAQPRRRVHVRSLIEGIRVRAVEVDGISPEIAEKAARATLRAFCSLETPDSFAARRVSAYFAAVVRRALVRTVTSPRATARFIIDSVVNDLTRSGREPEAVWDELERAWCDKVPHDVLEEYRKRLCA